MDKKRTKDDYSHVLKYTSLFGGVQGLGILVGLVRNKLVAMILGPSGMGLAALFQSTIKMVSDATNLGIPTSAVRNISDAWQNEDKAVVRRTVRIVRSWSIITAIMGMLLCVLLSPLLDCWTFSWGNHTLHFMLLSPIVALIIVTGGEAAILKGTRQMKALAKISVYHVLASLFISIPIYLFLGEKGIIPALLAMAVVMMLLTVAFSFRMFPFTVSFRKSLIKRGIDMVKLGIGFVVAWVMGSCAEFVIRSYLSHYGSLEELGLFNAGFLIAMTYGGMVFAAMETDYFPRLAAVKGGNGELSRVVNQQGEVSLLIIAPMLVALIIFMPILIPILFTGKFSAVVSMVQITMLALYLRAVKLPIAYIPLAKGHALLYMVMEGIYAVGIVVLSIILYNAYGLFGTGLAMLIMAIFDFFMLMAVMNWKYQYVMSKSLLLYLAMQLPIGILAYMFTYIQNTWIYYGLGLMAIVISSYASLTILKSKTHLWDSLKRKYKLKRS